MTATSTETLLIDYRSDAAWVTLNRPERRNAINAAMVRDLIDVFSSLADDRSARVIVLRGAGQGFCAGLDIREAQQGFRPDGKLEEAILALRACPQPVVGLVHGAACGGGFAFALACDIRIAGASAQFRDAFIELGVSGAELGLSFFLPRHVGLAMAAEIMYTGRTLSAPRAYALGLVSEVVDDLDLEAAGERIVADMVRSSPLALCKTKEMLVESLSQTDLATVMEMERQTQMLCLEGPDFEEGLKAFLEKRPPKFATG